MFLLELIINNPGYGDDFSKGSTCYLHMHIHQKLLAESDLFPCFRERASSFHVCHTKAEAHRYHFVDETGWLRSPFFCLLPRSQSYFSNSSLCSLFCKSLKNSAVLGAGKTAEAQQWWGGGWPSCFTDGF